MLTVPDAVQAWWHASGVSAVDSLAPERVPELERCCRAASKWIEAAVGFEIEKVTGRVLYLDGERASGRYGDTLELPHGHRMVTVSAITEDGAALTLATGYSTSANVIVAGNASERTWVRLRRRDQSWSQGVQNVSVTYTFGFDGADSGTPTVPAWIQQLANEVALLMFLSPNWIGKASMAADGVSMTWEKNLTPAGRGALDVLRGWSR